MAHAVRNIVIRDNEMLIRCKNELFLCRSCFLFRTISSASIRTKQFLRPLNIKVWYVILGTIIVAVSILVILLVKQEGIHSVTQGYNISILLTIGAISQQGAASSLIFYQLLR